MALNQHMAASRRLSRSRSLIGLLILGVLGALLVPLGSAPAEAAASTKLTRYPYLTDSIQNSMTINWATDRTGTTGRVKWGVVGPTGTCTPANSVAATRTAITVVAKAEYQWKAVVPVTANTRYCYRVYLGTTNLLGTDAPPRFTSQAEKGSSEPFSFAVLGDWGENSVNGSNPDQAKVMRLIANSGARFVVSTGDTGNPDGTQKNYGDLQQTGIGVSNVFGPNSWAEPGKSIPYFNVTGNHGFTSGQTQVINWPQENARQTSNGKYQMEAYPSINGSTAKQYPSMWYAFDAGPARFYALTAAWADGNIGTTGDPYRMDYEAHWKPDSPEYQWLEADLASHPNELKFAFWHYPLYSAADTEPSDQWLQGGVGSLRGLLNLHGVDLTFNGHAHGYQRYARDQSGMASYVVGNGGSPLVRVEDCARNPTPDAGDPQNFKPATAYARGSAATACRNGASVPGVSKESVYGFVKVTVRGRTVTVTPTDSLGLTYDPQTYNF